MVAKLPLPEYDSITVLRTVIAEREKFRDFYNAITDDWVAHVQNYLEHHGNPQIISPLALSPYISSASIIKEEARTNDSNRHTPARERVEQKRKKPYRFVFSQRRKSTLYDSK